ncbi:MAG: hypothetical protein K0M56_02315 [Kaistella sp.]|nr:hypothetical protein [Kaistella sp.]
MHKKFYTLSFIFFSYCIFGQLRLEFSLINSVANVSIYNESKENYVLPIDTLHFRPFETECARFSDFEAEFPSLALMLNFIDSDAKREEYVVGYKQIENIDSFNESINTKRDEFRKKIEKWGNRHSIKDDNLALINYNLVNNLIYIKSHDKVSFKIKFDLYNITGQELIYYNYILKKTNDYKLYLSMCNYTDINNFLAFSQRRKMKKYKLYTGKIESNVIEFKF